MADITFVLNDGSHTTLEAQNGLTVMQVATGAGLAGIVAECGGSAMCATCHVYVADDWLDRVDPPLANELEMLECTQAERRSGSRLSCQIKITDALSGLVVHMPSAQ
jgi:ferredoxin, 2Fe-2S